MEPPLLLHVLIESRSILYDLCYQRPCGRSWIHLASLYAIDFIESFSLEVWNPESLLCFVSPLLPPLS
jgi:hypothetical protein